MNLRLRAWQWFYIYVSYTQYFMIFVRVLVGVFIKILMIKIDLIVFLNFIVVLKQWL